MLLIKLKIYREVTMKKKKNDILSWDAMVAADSDRLPDLAAQQERLLSCSKLLNRTDRAIFKLASCGHYTHAEIAALLSISASSLSHHIARLKKILRHDFLVAVIQPESRSAEEQKIARIAHLKDRPLKTIAGEMGLSLYRVRKITADRKTQSQSKGNLILNQ
jgi:DNA-binding CsgD family transcriptional regulator